MGGAGIGHPGHEVRLGVLVVLGQDPAAVIPHLLHADPLVGGGGIAEIRPQERADFHLFPGSLQHLVPVRRDADDFPRAEAVLVLIPQVEVGEGFEGHAHGAVLFTENQRGAAHPVPGGVQAVLGQEQQSHRAVDQLLRVTDPLGYRVLLIDEAGCQLSSVDLAAAHFQEVGAAVGKGLPHQLLQVVNPPHGGDGVVAQMRPDNEGLGIGVADAADTQRPGHVVHVPLELGAEGRILDVVDGPLEPLVRAVDGHAAPAGAQMRVIVHPEKQIGDAIVMRGYAEYAAHIVPPWYKTCSPCYYSPIMRRIIS